MMSVSSFIGGIGNNGFVLTAEIITASSKLNLCTFYPIFFAFLNINFIDECKLFKQIKTCLKLR